MNDQNVLSTSLKEALDQRRNDFNATASQTIKKVFEEGVDAVAESGILSQAKQVGDLAPSFTLKNALGENVSLNDYLSKGPVVLTWYRGGWCPYCNITLRRLQMELPNIRTYGANLLALTPELPDKSLSTSEKHELEFEVLSDIGNQVAKDFGIVFKLIPEVAKIYQKAFDLHGYNGDESDELPLSATYVITPDGKITYSYLNADYRNRAEPSEILNALSSI